MTARSGITVRTSVIERGLYGDDYDAFAEAVRAAGYAVEIEEPAEQRSLGQAAVEVGIWIWENPENAAALAAVVDVIRRAAASTISRAKRARRTQQLKQLPIYGADGDVLAWIDLPAEDPRFADEETTP